jgi:hypothetical protein
VILLPVLREVIISAPEVSVDIFDLKELTEGMFPRGVDFSVLEESSVYPELWMFSIMERVEKDFFLSMIAEANGFNYDSDSGYFYTVAGQLV